MNALEEQLATLLKGAPGDPPAAVDADALLARVATRRRRRYLAPALAAAAVVAIAVPVAVLVTHDSGTPLAKVPPIKPTPAVSTTPADPHQAAIRTAETIIATAPMVSGASQVDQPPLAVLDEPGSIPGAQHVQRTRFWTAPGTVDAAIAYLKSHPPPGLSPSGSGSAGGPGTPTVEMLTFEAGAFGTDTFKSLQYSVVAFRGGVAVRADAQVIWAPRRSPADMVRSSVTSVDVVVVRKNPQLHQGAPTVRTTLTGAAARQLADVVNRLPRAVPTVHMSCPAMLGGEWWSDTLVFHSSGPTAEVVDNMTGCASITFQIGSRKTIQLDGNLNGPVLHALGLPAGYGGR
jgi:hypothetical protein